MNITIIDFNNIAMSRLHSKDVITKEGYNVENIDYDMWRFKVFSDVYWFIQKFNSEEVVIAVDNSYSWRKMYFPRYKEKRKGIRDKFNIDWKEYNQISTDFVNDMKIHLPFKILKIDRCEGDDIIGTIVLNKPSDKITIVSSDSDFLQLCRKNLKIFSIKKQQEISHPNPELFLQESCLIGQPKDNILNVVTPLDYPPELRKPPFGKKKAEKFLIDGIFDCLNKDVEYTRKYIDSEDKPKVYNSKINLKERYDFNRNLMDFKKIPETLKKLIVYKYNNYVYPEPDNIYKFIEKYNWRKFIDNVTNIENRLYQLYPSEKNKIEGF